MHPPPDSMMTPAWTFGVFKPDDRPCASDREIRRDLGAFGERLLPGAMGPKPNRPPGYAVLAQNPRLALHVADLAGHIEPTMRDPDEENVPALNLFCGCDATRLPLD